MFMIDFEDFKTPESVTVMHLLHIDRLAHILRKYFLFNKTDMENEQTRVNFTISPIMFVQNM